MPKDKSSYDLNGLIGSASSFFVYRDMDDGLETARKTVERLDFDFYRKDTSYSSIKSCSFVSYSLISSPSVIPSVIMVWSASWSVKSLLVRFFVAFSASDSLLAILNVNKCLPVRSSPSNCMLPSFKRWDMSLRPLPVFSSIQNIVIDCPTNKNL